MYQLGPRSQIWSAPLKCSCELCTMLAAFLKDPTRNVAHYSMNQSKRTHLEHQLAHYSDVTYTTEWVGTPPAHVVTKNQQLHKAKVWKHQARIALLDHVLTLLKQLENCFKVDQSDLIIIEHWTHPRPPEQWNITQSIIYHYKYKLCITRSAGWFLFYIHHLQQHYTLIYQGINYLIISHYLQLISQLSPRKDWVIQDFYKMQVMLKFLCSPMGMWNWLAKNILTSNYFFHTLSCTTSTRWVIMFFFKLGMISFAPWTTRNRFWSMCTCLISVMWICFSVKCRFKSRSSY